MPCDETPGPITQRELQVLVMVAGGMSAKEIAISLAIAPRTVECHIEHLRAKTRSRNRAHLAARAVWTGLVSFAPSLDGEVSATAS